MVALASSLGGSTGQHTKKLPVALSSARATPNERKPRAAKSLTAFSAAGFTCAALADSSRSPVAHLGDLNSFPSASLTVARCVYAPGRTAGMVTVSPATLVIFQAAHTAKSMVVDVRARRQPASDDFDRRDVVDG